MTITLHKTHFVPQSCAWYADLQNLFLLNKEMYRVISKHASNCTRKTTFYYLMVQVTVKSSLFLTILKMNDHWTMDLPETFQFEVMSSRITAALRQRYLHGGGTEWTPLYCPSITDRCWSTTHLSVVYYTVVMRQDQRVRLPSKTI